MQPSIETCKKEPKTHLLGIFSVADQTLNNRTTDTTVVPAINDHLMPEELSKNSEPAKVKSSIN